MATKATDGKPTSIKSFHILLAFSFFLAYFLADDETLRLHAIFGAIVLFLAILRAGLFALKDQDYSLSSLNLCIKNLKDYLLHYFSYTEEERKNPASSWAMILLLVLGVLTPVSGIMTLYVQDIKDVHEFFGQAFLMVVSLHIAGVVSDRLFHGTHLIEQMSMEKSVKSSTLVTVLVFVGLLIGIIVGSVLNIADYEKWHEERKALHHG